MRYLIGSVTMSLLLLTSASAQQPPQPTFEPYTVGAQEHQAILNYLGDVPAKYANPLIGQLMQMEQAAQKKKGELAAPIEKPEFGRVVPNAKDAK